MNRVTLALIVVLVALSLFAGGGWLYMKVGMRGFSARSEPSTTEAMVAEYARTTAMPASARSLRNPIVLTPAIQHEAMAHFADHCAVCHSNNGDGRSMFGKGMYPRPPDLRTGTQKKSDGEIFFYIENGIRMSGMPAFGGDGTADDSWRLVAFIRHLPQLTPAEEMEMNTLNPKTPAEAAEEKQEEQFLNGDSSSSSAPTHPLKGHTL